LGDTPGTGGQTSTGGQSTTGGHTGGSGSPATGGSNGTGGQTTATGGAGGTGGNGGSGGSGSGGTPGTGGKTTTTDGGVMDSGTLPAGNGLPCEVTSLLTKCQSCHGATPASGAPSSLVTYANLTAPSKTDGTKSEAAIALVRMASTASPMPPAGSARPSAAEIAAMQAWVNAGTPSTACGTAMDGGVPGTDAGTSDAGLPSTDPLNKPAQCTSMTTWTKGNSGSASMNPGMACITCHSSGEGPRFALAGTLYATGHEPDRCNGSASTGTNGAKIVITGANGQSITLTPNSVGNFSYTGSLTKPYTAKVTYMGRERLMGGAQTNGDCNSCHTQTGSSSAPGRITLP